MEKLLQTGKVKAIGVSNCSKAEVEHILKNTSVVPAVHQMECHPWLQQQAFTTWHREKGIHVTHYSPFGNQNELYSGPKHLGKLIQHPVLCDIGKKYKKSGAQAALGRLSLWHSWDYHINCWHQLIPQPGELLKVIPFCPSPKLPNASRQTWKEISNSVTRIWRRSLRLTKSYDSMTVVPNLAGNSSRIWMENKDGILSRDYWSIHRGIKSRIELLSGVSINQQKTWHVG